MKEHRSSRTLVKSAPELWAECSDAKSLARHLGAFGEIRITKLEPEIAVAWEGDAASGTVTLEPSGWGTRVILTVTELRREPAADDPRAANEANPIDEAVSAPPTDREDVDSPSEPPPLAFDGAWSDDAIIRASRFGKLRMRLWRRPELDGVSEPEVTAARLAVGVVDPPADVAESISSLGEPAAQVVEPPQGEAERRPMSPFDDQDEDGAPLALAAALDSLGRAHHRPYSRD